MLTKQTIRSKILLKLKTQKEENRDRKSQVIKNKLFRTKEFRKAKKVMFYIALKGEVNTKEMIEEAKKQGKTITVPVCCRDSYSLRPCILDDHAKLKLGPYGVHEPVEEKCLRLADLDLIIVPGLAFDKSGNRLGRGKGYYDRFLSKLPSDTQSVGLAFDFQILPFVPTTEHDVSVTRVISN
jgi:5-formyltetrahydrofolate cyclo-ligase